VTESILVRAPVGVAYRTLTDLDAWPRWHSGCRSRRIDRPAGTDRTGGAPAGADRFALVLPSPRRGPGPRSWSVEVTAHGWRHDLGVRWDVGGDGLGDVRLASEWWLESRTEGTVVHHVVHDAVVRDRRVALHRRAIMHAMQAMKDHLELAVALASGRIP
jgi:hypothetical protein